MFKYFRVDGWSLNNLRNSTFYLNHHSAFNDPFECRCEVRKGFPQLGDTSGRFADVLRAWGFEKIDDKDALEYYEDYVFSLDGGEPDIEHYIDCARITCFSRRPDNLLMWAHYADGLRGFCVEFDRREIADSLGNAKIYDVSYVETPSVVDASVMAVLHDQWYFNNEAFVEVDALSKRFDEDRKWELSLYEAGIEDAYSQLQDLYQKMLATKPLAWSYEEELRLIDCCSRDNCAGVILPYPTSAVVSVILGEKITQEHENAIVGIVSQHFPTAKIKKAIRVNGSFDVHIVDYV